VDGSSPVITAVLMIPGACGGQGVQRTIQAGASTGQVWVERVVDGDASVHTTVELPRLSAVLHHRVASVLGHPCSGLLSQAIILADAVV
jgi:hypothetical protein